jgi:hypothetical protein
LSTGNEWEERRSIMNERIDRFWNAWFQRGITSKHDLLREMIRIIKTKKYILPKDSQHPEKLFEAMKKYVDGNDLGYFPGDQDFFFRIYHLAVDIDIIDFTIETFRGDRMELASPTYLVQYFSTLVKKQNPKTILIVEAEKMLQGIREMIFVHKDVKFTLTTQHLLMYEVLQLAFEKEERIEIVQCSIYYQLQLDTTYDAVIAIPSFGGKYDWSDISTHYITNDSEGIATQNLLEVVREEGTLYEIVPARLTFASGQTSKWRAWINQHYSVESLSILPEGTFRPYSAIKTYFLSITRREIDDVKIGQLECNHNQLNLIDHKQLPLIEFVSYEDWRIELLLTEDREEIKRFKQISTQKVKLGEIGEVFRGKSIMKGDLKPGEIYVLNISNIDNGEVILGDMETIDEDERKVKRYELQKNDLVMTCRGTVTKVAIYYGSKQKVIASANIIAIRIKENILSEFVKIFLESPVGITLIKSFQRGTTVMNINPKDISELEIPLLEVEQQQAIIEQYKIEFEQYKQTIEQATKRWQEQRENVYNRILSSKEEITWR